MPRKKPHPFLSVSTEAVAYRMSAEAQDLRQRDYTQSCEHWSTFGADVEGLARARREFDERWRPKADEGFPLESPYAFPQYRLRTADGSYQPAPSEFYDRILLTRIEGGGEPNDPVGMSPFAYVLALLNYHYAAQASDNLQDKFVRYVHNLVQGRIADYQHPEPAAAWADESSADEALQLLLTAQRWDPRKARIKPDVPENQSATMPTTKQLVLLLSLLRDEERLHTLEPESWIALLAVVAGAQPESIRRYLNARKGSGQHYLYTEANVEWAVDALERIGLQDPGLEKRLQQKVE